MILEHISDRFRVNSDDFGTIFDEKSQIGQNPIVFSYSMPIVNTKGNEGKIRKIDLTFFLLKLLGGVENHSETHFQAVLEYLKTSFEPLFGVRSSKKFYRP